MNIVVPVKLVPDLVEELSIDSSGKALDTSWLRLIVNEFDDHAIEQAVLLKESGGGQVTIVAMDLEGVDDLLFTAAAKGADRLIKLGEMVHIGTNNHAMARVLAGVVKDLHPDLILTGVQAHDDLDGSVGPLLAGQLGMPYLGYVAGVSPGEGKVVARKEYPGGLVAEMEVRLPAVLGIQASEKPPRYVAVSKVRQAMQATTIEVQPLPELDSSGAVAVERIFQPESAGRATMIEGEVEEVAARFVEILKEAGVL
jgi:electron transfer flavoprotein beta subunit